MRLSTFFARCPLFSRVPRPTAWLGLAAIFLASLGLSADDQTSPDVRGAALAAELRSDRPAEPFTTAGVLRLRDSNGKWRAQIPVRMDVRVGPRSWQNSYEALGTNNAPAEVLVVTHEEPLPNRYQHFQAAPERSGRGTNVTLLGNAAAVPFAGSEFWLSDLGLEFLHWPEQRLLRHEMRKGRSCHVLESVNPDPQGAAYARVLSWIDIEHHGLLRAEAYGKNHKLVKEFSIGGFKKVDGKWQLKSMEIRNEQTDARTRLEFDLEIAER